jgi:hypothetical protein
MPGVGVTDTHEIFRLVGDHRERVLASVVVQLVSAALYVAAVVGLASDARIGAARGIRARAVLLGIGAAGSAADAVFHLLAYAMTAPGLDPTALVPVMQFMQGPGLRLLAPLLLAFVAGSAWLSIAAARAGIVSRANPRWFLGAALATVIVDVLAPWNVGLGVVLFLVAAQVGVGAGLIRSRSEASVANEVPGHGQRA